jgi:hypothetical protein
MRPQRARKPDRVRRIFATVCFIRASMAAPPSSFMKGSIGTLLGGGRTGPSFASAKELVICADDDRARLTCPDRTHHGKPPLPLPRPPGRGDPMIATGTPACEMSRSPWPTPSARSSCLSSACSGRNCSDDPRRPRIRRRNYENPAEIPGYAAIPEAPRCTMGTPLVTLRFVT